jgi:hypothetical protein
METPLDRAHAAMVAAPDDDAARLRFHERVADAGLFLLLAREAVGDEISPEIFTLSDGDVMLAFDREERLAAFTGRPSPFASLSGRRLVGMLAGRGIGLGLNLGAVSEYLLAPEAIEWLAGTLAGEPEEVDARIEAVHAPAGLPEDLLEGLSAKLAAAEGLARHGWLAGADYPGGRRSHLLAFTGTLPGAEAALARAVSEALIFSGVEAGEIDVLFLGESDPLAARLARVALRFDLPEPVVPKVPEAPGVDPSRPPKLR